MVVVRYSHVLVCTRSNSDLHSSLIDRTESPHARLTKYTRVVVTAILVQAINSSHFLLCQIKIENGSILLHPSQAATFAYWKSVSLDWPTEHHLCRSFVVSLTYPDDCWILKEKIISCRHVQTNIRSPTERRKCRDSDPRLSRKPDELTLSEMRMAFNLKACRTNHSSAQYLTTWSMMKLLLRLRNWKLKIRWAALTWRMCWQLKLLSPMKRVLPVRREKEWSGSVSSMQYDNTKPQTKHQQLSPTRRYETFHCFPSRWDIVLN